MNNKFYIIFGLGLILSSKMFGQDCQSSYERGTVLKIAESNGGYFCFKKDPEPLIDSVPDVYHTKYTIAFGKGRETYTIHFYFYKKLDSISIKYMNTISGKTTTAEIPFSAHSSIRMFKNYRANDTTINEQDKYGTLFTIMDTLRPYVTLNVFQLPDNKNTYLAFVPINPEKLLQHRNETASYFAWEDSIAIVKKAAEEKRARHKQTIDSILRDMNDYKVRTIQTLTDDDISFKMNGPVMEATDTYLAAFKAKTDPLVLAYFKKIYPFENYDSEIRFSFTCDGEGKMDIQKIQIEAVNSLRIPWLEDSFKVNIQPYIENAVYKTISTQRANPGLIATFNKRYSDAVNYLKSGNTENAEYKEFVLFKNKIYDDLEKYMLSRDISTPTMYTYTFKYKSTISIEDWIYEINKKGVEKIGPKNTNEVITEDLKTVFKEKIAKPKIGKYHIKICRVYINDNLVGWDIRPEEIKK